ncbi:hypothetical protein GCM10028796_46610 [Ramlibacter monticola]|uniref:Uncharacterized protein n=1 Tax=Ramlibacter monticola TaxID=1926872 RepID=A0A936Z783_9BURK|nr:hypothetical protein [Ramlibacter monticola]MBL0394286.1 hypothetical protein [Ramlibacter monticola]
MTLFRTAALVLALSPGAVFPQAADTELRLPSGAEVARSLATICSAEAQGATLGFAARESGMSLETVLARMPDPPDPGLKSIYRGIRRTVQDVYEHRSISYFAMFYYRSKACFRERTELMPLPSVAFSAAGLLRCESEFGREGGPELLACVEKVVGAL